jgi:signal transduction histidine kinase
LADRPEEHELLSELSGQLRELAETVSENLEFVRPIAPTRASLDPVALVEASLTRALARAPRPSEIERRYAEVLPTIAADAELIGASITNLIVNACEAMAAADGRQPSQLVLELSARAAQRPTRTVRVEDGCADAPEPDATARELVISISDNGPGIPLELREKIFYPFFTTKQGGSGIGLANVQKVVLAHGGSVTLEVPEAGGCTFRVQIPVIDPEAEAAGAEPA